MKLFFTMLAVGASITLAQAATPVLENVSTKEHAPYMETWKGIQKNTDQVDRTVIKGNGYTITQLGTYTKQAPAKTRADEDEEEGGNLTINVIVPQGDGRTYQLPYMSIMIDNGDWVEDRIRPESMDWDGSTPLHSSYPLEYGDYHYTLLLSFEAEGPYLGQIIMHKPFTVEGDMTIDIDLTEAKNCIYTQAVMPNGENFPIMEEPDPENPFAPYVFSMYSHNIVPNYGLTSMLQGLFPLHFYVNDLTESDIRISNFTKYYDATANDGCAFMSTIYGPFTSDMVDVINADEYKTVNEKFFLTDSEYDPTQNGTYLSFKNIDANGWMYALNSESNCGRSQYLSDINIKARVLPQGSGLVDWQVFTPGLFCGPSPNFWMNDSKHAGGIVNVDGTLYVVGVPYIDRAAQTTYYLSPYEPYNIVVGSQDLLNFYFTPYLTPMVDLWTDQDQNVANVSVGLTRVGPFNEDATVYNVFEKLTSIKYNGESFDSPDGIMGKSTENAEIEFSFSVPVVVDQTIQTTTDFNYFQSFKDADDTRTPEMTGYGVFDKDGKLVNHLADGQGAKFVISAKDTNDMNQPTENMVCKLEFAAQDSDEWTEMTANKLEVGMQTGTVLEADLAAIPTDGKWYKVRATFTDAVGNYIQPTLNHCFMIGTSAVNTMVEGNVVSTQYFDMSGRRVANPENGIFVKAQTLENGQVRYMKEVIR